MNNIEGFVRQSVATHLSLSDSKLEELVSGIEKDTEFGVSIVLLIEIAIAVITVVIKDCLDKYSMEEFIHNIRNAGVLRRVKFYLMFRRHLSENAKSKVWLKDVRSLVSHMEKIMAGMDDAMLTTITKSINQEDDWWLI